MRVPSARPPPPPQPPPPPPPLRGIMLFLLLLPFAAAHPNRGFLVAAPKRLLAGSTERVCLAFLNVSGPAQVQLTLLAAESDERLAAASHRVLAEEAACVPLAVPAAPAAQPPPPRARLLVQARFDRAYDYVVSAVREVRLQAQPLLVFVQTERAVYRPGQQLRVRVLTLRHDLTAAEGAVAAAWLLTPAEVRLAQWARPPSAQGLVQLEFQLGPEPPLGNWSVRVLLNDDATEHSASFAVREYALPRFAVSIEGPAHVLADASHVAWRVCARYTHGEAVRGRVVARAEPHVPAWRAGGARAPAVAAGELDGCFGFNVSAAMLGLRDWDAAPAAVRLHAEVTEAGTGAAENASREVSVQHQALLLSFLPDSPRYFKPGLPYAGRLRAVTPDGAPAARRTLQLCLKARRRNEWSRSLVQCRNFSSGADGQLRFRVPPQSDDVQLLSLVATAVDFPTKYYAPGTRWRVLMDQPSAFFDVHAWFSPSNHFLEVVDDDPHGPRCGAPHEFTVYYTGDAPQELRYLVSSRGDIVQAGVAAVSAVSGPEPPHPHTLGESSASPPSPPPPPRRLTLSLKVSARMAPAAALLVYRAGLPGGEVAAAALALRVPSCFANSVRAAFLRTRHSPGGEATLRVRAAPQSLCALAATDRASAALGLSTLLDEQRVFEALDAFHIQPFHLPKQADDVDYCARKAANLSTTPASPFSDPTAAEADFAKASAAASDTEPAFWDLRRRRRRRRSLDGNPEDAPASKVVDAIQAFDEAGILVLTDQVLETRPCHWLTSNHGGANTLHFRGTVRKGHGGGGGGALGMAVGLPLQHRQFGPSPAGLPPPGAPGGPPPAPAHQVMLSGDVVRSHFPETWLWELLPMGNATWVDVRRRLPDSITQWEARVSCVAPRLGLGVSPPAHITAFQPFFLDLALPYSVKRGEVLLLKASLFNYLPHSLPVRVSLSAPAALELLGEAGAVAGGGRAGASVTGCATANSSLVVTFRARALRVGVLNVTLSAEVEPLLPQRCGPDFVLAQRDALLKPLLVIAEGFPVQRTYSAFICPANFSGDSSVSWRLLLPADVIEDSARADVSIVSDLLGPTLQNLGHLVRLPMGCGEQNMILFVPNLHVIGYLNATRRLTVGMHTEALKNLQKGYQRQLNYRHADGSYSAFGEQDGEGSLWLTAFVVRALALARRHIFIDDADLAVSVKWVLRRQLENGCFPPVGQVFHKDIRGGLDDEAPSSALTAYVLISLLEARLPLARAVTDNAFFCLTADARSGGTYPLALKALALALLRERERERARRGQQGHGNAHAAAAHEALRRLLGAATREEGLLWWEAEAGGANRALDVETTAYGILALLRAGSNEHLLLALDAVRWVARQANAQGGFVSTQDTVVALEALTQYASLVPQQRTALSLLLTASGVQEKFHIGHEERLIVQTVALPELPTRLEVQAEGDGCALVQASLRYNVVTPSGSDSFDLDVQTGPVASVDACAVQRVEMCVRFKLPGQASNMAVLSVAMVSGYRPDRPSLHYLAVNQGPLGFKRWEEEEDKVNFYFEKLTNKWNCLSFLISQESEVENPSYAVVTVYDYYHQELSLSQKYSTDAGCRNERLPDPQPHSADNKIFDLLDKANITLGDAPSSTLDNTESVAINNHTGVPDHLNPQFVNVDHELDTPSGEEGPVTSHSLLQSDSAVPSEEEGEYDVIANCPHCSSSPPHDLAHLYCNSNTVYKMTLKRGHARIIMDLSPRRAPKRFKKNVLLRMNENCNCEPLTRVGETQHFILMSQDEVRTFPTAMKILERILVDERISIFSVPVQPGQTEVIKNARQSCG